MRVEFFIDPASGWCWWTSQSLVEDGPQTDEGGMAAPRRPADQRLALRLLGRVGAWRRIRTGRRDPWEPGARRNHSSVWSWWCP
jgi:hypothetical protein